MQKNPTPKMFGAVTVGERGQVVIPAQIRKIFHIKSGEKLIVFANPGGPIGFLPQGQLTHFLEQATAMLTKIKKNTT